MAIDPKQLAASPLFAGFTDTGLEVITTIAKERDVPKGMSVFLAGTSGDGLFFVVRGKVEILAGPSGQERVLCALGPGESFGELALLRAAPRAVTARAVEPTHLIEIKRADFNAALKQKPQACLKLMLSVFNLVESRMRPIEGEILALAGRS